MSDRETRKANVVEALNKARSMELHAIHQYMNQHYNLDDMDYGELAANMKLIAIDEMRHCEMFAERIKELGGEPTSEVAGKVVKGQEVKAIYSSDSDSEDDTIFVYNELRKVCVDKKHPHVRGEDPRQYTIIGRDLETPPRAWGRRPPTTLCKEQDRNTPTCVGKTGCDTSNLMQKEKHPHVRGEDTERLFTFFIEPSKQY